METVSKSLIGVAGEYYVSFRLSMLEYAVGLTAGGTPNVDLVVANPRNGKSIAIQVKTMRKARYGDEWKWRVGTSFEIANRSIYWAFVDLKEQSNLTPSEPDVYFVSPTEKVSEVPKGSAATNFSTPYHLYRYNSDVWFVIEHPDSIRYRNNWDVIKSALQ